MLACVGCRKNTTEASELSEEVEIIYEYVDDDTSTTQSTASGGNVTTQKPSNKPTASASSVSTASSDNSTSVVSKVYTINGGVTGYITKENGSAKLKKINDADITVSKNFAKLSADIIANIDPDSKYQTIEGFGGALTDSSCANLNQMPADKRNMVMQRLFSREDGLGLNFLRQPCGVTDYAVDWHTYDDMPEGQEDMSLAHFSIDCDREYILPYLKQAISINPEIKVISSVWSPPLWMKTRYSWITTPEGNDLSIVPTEQNTAMLRRDCYDVFAQYLIKYIQAYAGEGIPITSIVPQNEPTGRHGIPATYYTADRMSDLINNHIAPAFRNAGITTEIWSWDFNFFPQEAEDFTRGAIDNIQGIAMHYPSSDVDLITNLKYKYDRPVYLTETGSGEPATVISWLRAGASAVIRWNLTLDEYGGPSDNRNPHIWHTPQKKGGGVIGYNTSTDEVSYNTDYYTLAHFSKFIKRGAAIVYSDNMSFTQEFVSNITALNPDGSVATVVSNQLPKAKAIALVYGEKTVKYTMPPQSTVTFVWNSATK